MSSQQARDDAAFLRYFAASLTYNDTTADGEAKRRLHEIAMRIETVLGGAAPPLTDEQIDEIAESAMIWGEPDSERSLRQFARAILATQAAPKPPGEQPADSTLARVVAHWMPPLATLKGVATRFGDGRLAHQWDGHRFASVLNNAVEEICAALSRQAAMQHPSGLPQEPVAEVDGAAFVVAGPMSTADPARGLVRWLGSTALWPGTKLYAAPSGGDQRTEGSGLSDRAQAEAMQRPVGEPSRYPLLNGDGDVRFDWVRGKECLSLQLEPGKMHWAWRLDGEHAHGTTAIPFQFYGVLYPIAVENDAAWDEYEAAIAASETTASARSDKP